MKKLLMVFLSGCVLASSGVRAEGLSSFMASCKLNQTLNEKGLTSMADAMQAFYCRGFVSGYYLSLLSQGTIKEDRTCSSKFVDESRLLTFLISSYEQNRKRQAELELPIFESQPPEWFVEKSLISYCKND